MSSCTTFPRLDAHAHSGEAHSTVGGAAGRWARVVDSTVLGIAVAFVGLELSYVLLPPNDTTPDDSPLEDHVISNLLVFLVVLPSLVMVYGPTATAASRSPRERCSCLRPSGWAAFRTRCTSPKISSDTTWSSCWTPVGFTMISMLNLLLLLRTHTKYEVMSIHPGSSYRWQPRASRWRGWCIRSWRSRPGAICAALGTGPRRPWTVGPLRGVPLATLWWATPSA